MKHETKSSKCDDIKVCDKWHEIMSRKIIRRSKDLSTQPFHSSIENFIERIMLNLICLIMKYHLHDYDLLRHFTSKKTKESYFYLLSIFQMTLSFTNLIYRLMFSFNSLPIILRKMKR